MKPLQKYKEEEWINIKSESDAYHRKALEPAKSFKRQKGILLLTEPSKSRPMFMFSRPDQWEPTSPQLGEISILGYTKSLLAAEGEHICGVHL